jgi:anti-sigma factor RsiW
MDEQSKNSECEAYQILMMGYIDGELSGEDEKRFKDHAYKCPACAEELVKYQKLAELTDSLQLKEPADYEWERIYKNLFNKIETRFGWICAISGLVILFAYLMYEIAVGWEISAWFRIGLALALVGFVLLLLSAARHRMRIKKFERYEAVKR